MDSTKNYFIGLRLQFLIFYFDSSLLMWLPYCLNFYFFTVENGLVW